MGVTIGVVKTFKATPSINIPRKYSIVLTIIRNSKGVKDVL